MTEAGLAKLDLTDPAPAQQRFLNVPGAEVKVEYDVASTDLTILECRPLWRAGHGSAVAAFGQPRRGVAAYGRRPPCQPPRFSIGPLTGV